jgi:hypothetical protein
LHLTPFAPFVRFVTRPEGPRLRITGYGARTTPLHAGMTGYGTQHGGLRRAAPCDKKTRNYQTKPKKRGKTNTWHFGTTNEAK